MNVPAYERHCVPRRGSVARRWAKSVPSLGRTCVAGVITGRSASVGCVSGHGSPLRIGILGAARIAPMALIKAAKDNSDVMVAGVAARDASRAKAFAADHDIPRVHE